MTARGRSLVAILAAALCCTAALAGGPQYTYDYANRIPYAWSMARWENGQVPVYTDLGALGPLDNLQAYSLVANAIYQWSNVPTSSFRAAYAGDVSALGVNDVTAANVTSVIGTYNGGGIDVIYDSDGSIMENFFGVSSAVLGITNIDYINTGTPEILEAWMVLSGPGVDPADTFGVGFSGVVTHEMGHALNLAHSQTNGAVQHPNILDAAQPSGCPAPWTETVNASEVETMFPIGTPEPGESGEYMGTVDRIDDMAALSNLYPAPGWPGSKGTIRGKIFDSSGNEVTAGVNVIARNVANPFNDCSSYISGQVTKGQAGPDGSFELNGLTPGATYVIYVDNLLQGAFPVPRYVMLPGFEEYYNGAMESGDASTDNRCGWTTIKVTAGAPVTANITFNHMTGAPTLLQAPDNGIVHDMTPDGTIVVGATDNDGDVIRWNLNTGEYEDLGGIVTGQAAVSDDGSKIAANILDTTDNILKPAIYEDGLWTPLPPVANAVACNNTQAGLSYGSTYDISGDGNTVVGLSYGMGGCYGGTTRAFKWSPGMSNMQQLPKADSFDRAGRANAVNYDGSVIVGWDDASNGLRRGEQWRNGTASLIKRGTNPVGEALKVSADGQWITGAINFATTSQAWRYRYPSGVEMIGALPGQTGGVTSGMNSDASVIVGYSTNLNTGLLTPTIWTSGLHWTDLNQFFATQGINTIGGFILSGYGVSSDGTTIAGTMQSQFGYVPWALKIPTVLTCHLGQTTTASFPQGMNAALAQGDVLGPCQCSSAAPAGVASVSITKRVVPAPGTTRVSWTAVAEATGYDIVRGSLAALRSGGGDFSGAINACLQDDLGFTTLDDGNIPNPGDGFFYLVTATTCGGHGTYDSGAPGQVASRDAGIQASPYACP